MKKNKIFLILIVSITIYTIPELLFDEAMLYISGGVLGGSIFDIFKLFRIELKDSDMILIWFCLLVGITLIFLIVNNKLIKYFILVILLFFLYVFDFISFEIISNESVNYNLLKLVRVILKGFILSVILYYGLIIRRKQKIIEKNT